MYYLLCTSFLGFSIVGVVASSQAAVYLSSSANLTVDLPGYITYQLTANADPGQKIIGFDFVGNGNLGFFGSMNQVNPAGISTVFQDANAFFGFVGKDVSQDSQFRFNSTAGVVTNPSESNTHLQAAFRFHPAVADSRTHIWQFAQLCLPYDSAIKYRGSFTVRDMNGVESTHFVGRIPEPSTLALTTLALFALLNHARCRRSLFGQLSKSIVLANGI